MSFVETMIKPLIDEAYRKGFEAGVNAEILREKKELTERETYLYKYGYAQGEKDAKASTDSIDIDDLIKEVSEIVREDTIAQMNEKREPFGFVGTLDDMSLVLEGDEA